MTDVISCFLPGAELDRAALGLLGAGQKLAQDLGATHVVVAAGASDGLTAAAGQYAGRLLSLQSDALSADNPESVLAALQSACGTLEPSAVLLGQDAASQELTPRLGRRLGGCSIGDAQSIAVEDGSIRVTRSVYGGKAVAVVRANTSPAVIWVRSRAFEPAEALSSAATAEELAVTIEGNITATTIVGRDVQSSSDVRLEDAAVIVSGGRGLGGPEPFDDLKQLAAVMKAEVGASRAACDAGWVAPGLQIGQTGKKVAPELYVAVAISGASQHLMGISDSKVVAAINTDAEAPIFKQCQFGLVEDWQNVVGPLKEQIEALS